MKASAESARNELLEQDRRFAASSREHGPAEAFRTFIHPRGSLLTAAGENVTGKQAIFERMQALPAGTSLSWEPQDAGVANSGELGWTWGEYVSDSPAEDGHTTRQAGRYLNVWQRDESGNWRVLLDLGT
jgi:ketosteroid isomerase-like protein